MSVPKQFKKLKKYIREGKKLTNRQPGAAYYTLLFAVQQAITIDSKSADAKTFIGTVMDDMERIKTSPSFPNIGKEEHKANIEELALRVFDAADQVDKRGESTKKTAQAFSTAGILCDILKQFGDRDEEIVTKGKYALAKTGSILIAIKQGRKPEAGIPDEMKAKVEDEQKLPGPNSIGLPAPNAIDFGRQDIIPENNELRIDDTDVANNDLNIDDAPLSIGLGDELMSGPSAPAVDVWKPPSTLHKSTPLEELVDVCAGVEETVGVVISSLRLKDLNSALATMKQFVEVLGPYNTGGNWRPKPGGQKSKSEACDVLEDKMRHMVSALRFMDVYAALAILGQCIRISSQYCKSSTRSV